MINIKKYILTIILCSLFNIQTIDSNSDKLTLYNKDNIYEEEVFKIYFVNTTSKDLESILNILDINVLSYIIDDKKYYARDLNDLYEKYTKDKTLQDKIYYEKYGIKIDGINIKCQINELIKLDNLVDIY